MREQAGSHVGAQPALEGARGVLAGEIEDQIGGGDEAGGVAGEDRLVDEVLRQHRLAQAVRRRRG